jgi:SlyX protein
MHASKQERDVVTELDELKSELMEVQSQLAFQEDTIQALNEAISSQQQEMLVLRRQLELLKQRQEEQVPGQEPAGESSLLDEKPPHY